MERLAINGGQPVRNKLLPYGHHWVNDEDIAAVVEVLKGDWLSQGPKVDEFEKRVSEYCGAKYAVAVSSGTAALHAAYAIAGISAGNEAIVPTLTFAATANVVVYCGGRPVFADIKEDTLNIDPEDALKRISPKTKAILPVDFAGNALDFDALKAIAREKGLIVIEDACHALGATYHDRKIGSLSDMTILSFHPVKNITTGEGGMILTDNEEFYQKLRIFRHHGIIKDNPYKGSWHYDIYSPGYNFRLTDFQCALGISQMNKLDRFITRRREIAVKYKKAFSEIKEIINPVETSDAKHAYHLYVIQLSTEMLRAERKEIFDALIAENIGVNVHYMPLHLHPFYQKEFGYKKGDYPIAEKYYERAITLPLFPAMSNDDVEDVIKAVYKVISYYRK